MKRRIQGAHPFLVSFGQGGLSGGGIITNYTGMSVPSLSGLIDSRAYAVTSASAARVGRDELIDRMARLDDVLRHARLILAKGPSQSTATSAQWSAFRSAINAGAATSRAATNAVGERLSTEDTGTGTSTTYGPPQPSSPPPPETTPPGTTGKEWTEPEGPEGPDGGLFDSPLVLAGIVGVGVMIVALVAGRK